MQQILRLKNVGTDRFSDMYDNQKYTIEPGGETLAPYEAVCLWLGDPEFRDLDARRRNRTDEYERLCTRLGVYHDQHLFESARPKLEAWTLDGQRITTVSEDPTGSGMSINLAADSTTEAILRDQLDSMKQQMDAITVALESAPDSQKLVLDAVSPHDASVAVDPKAPLDSPIIPVEDSEAPSEDGPPADSPSKVKVGTRARSK
jgi:hypothetical protein